MMTLIAGSGGTGAGSCEDSSICPGIRLTAPVHVSKLGHERTPGLLDLLHALTRQLAAPAAGLGAADKGLVHARVFRRRPQMRLLLFQFAHAIGRTLLDGEVESLRIRGASEKARDFVHLPHGVRLQGLVTHQKKTGMVAANEKPAAHVIEPRSVPVASLISQKTLDKIAQRIALVDLAALDLKVIFRQHHIARIAHDAQHFLVARIKILMTLENSWPGKLIEVALR